MVSWVRCIVIVLGCLTSLGVSCLIYFNSFLRFGLRCLVLVQAFLQTHLPGLSMMSSCLEQLFLQAQRYGLYFRCVRKEYLFDIK